MNETNQFGIDYYGNYDNDSRVNSYPELSQEEVLADNLELESNQVELLSGNDTDKSIALNDNNGASIGSNIQVSDFAERSYSIADSVVDYGHLETKGGDVIEGVWIKAVDSVADSDKSPNAKDDELRLIGKAYKEQRNKEA